MKNLTNKPKAKRGKLAIASVPKLDNPIASLIKLTKGPTDVIAGLRLKAAIIIASPKKVGGSYFFRISRL